jgi:hypothetical protein
MMGRVDILAELRSSHGLVSPREDVSAGNGHAVERPKRGCAFCGADLRGDCAYDVPGKMAKLVAGVRVERPDGCLNAPVPVTVAIPDVGNEVEPDLEFADEAEAEPTFSPFSPGVTPPDLASKGLSPFSPLSPVAAPKGWPKPMREAAYHGLAGQIIGLISPRSEADPAALLVQLLVGFGNVIGRGPHFTVEADNHHANLNVVVVGETSKGRKGSGYGHGERLLRSADPTWADQIETGLSSGEGLIWRVRDASGDGDDADDGEFDKRLMVFESEFASVLRNLERHGNTLSPVIRDAWDGRVLRTLTKGSPARATGAHISIIGHITDDELRRYLTRTEVGNGFGNRYLWVCSRRQRLLPEGGDMHKVDVSPYVKKLGEAITFSRSVEEVTRDAEARELWHRVYGVISAGMPGIAGALTGRAEAQVMRLALIYALLDQSAAITKPHLEAALAVWDYAVASVLYIFPGSLGDPIADAVYPELTRRGRMGRNDIRELLGHSIESARIDQSLSLLGSYGLAHSYRVETGGRPAEMWAPGRALGEKGDNGEKPDRAKNQAPAAGDNGDKGGAPWTPVRDRPVWREEQS